MEVFAMLVLTIKEGHDLIINNDIIVTVLEVNKGNVRVGIEAPKHISVVRDNAKQKIESPCADATT